MKIIALHGQLGMDSDWISLSNKLEEFNHHLFAVDLWKYLSLNKCSMEAFARMLNEGENDGGILMGYSMGGRLALHALIDDSRKWKAAVIISANIGLSVRERECRREKDTQWAEKIESLRWGEFLDEWNQQSVLNQDVMPDRSSLECKKQEIARSFGCWGLGEQEDLLVKLESLEVPVLWVVGGKDEKFCKQGERAMSVLKNAQLYKIPFSGHRVPWEAEDAFLLKLVEWIKQLSGQ